MLSVPERVQ
jgi:hypothetical protein